MFYAGTSCSVVGGPLSVSSLLYCFSDYFFPSLACLLRLAFLRTSVLSHLLTILSPWSASFYPMASTLTFIWMTPKSASDGTRADAVFKLLSGQVHIIFFPEKSQYV